MWADGFSRGDDSLDVLVRNNGGREGSRLLAAPCSDNPGLTLRAGCASPSPGRATSFIDHNCLSGSWLLLWLQNLSRPGSSTRPSPRRPISAMLSSAHPDSVPQILREHNELCVAGSRCIPSDVSPAHTTAWLCQLKASFPRNGGHWGPLTPCAVKLPCFMPLPASISRAAPGLSGRWSWIVTGRIHRNPVGVHPPPGTIRGFPQTLPALSYPGPRPGPRAAFCRVTSWRKKLDMPLPALGKPARLQRAGSALQAPKLLKINLLSRHSPPTVLHTGGLHCF